MEENDKCRVVKYDQLIPFVKTLFTGCGLSASHAEVMAESLVFADLRNISTHGVARVKSYVDRIESGAINIRPDLKQTKSFMGTAVVDADNGPGQVAGAYAMRLAIERARQFGVSLCGVINGGHIGALAYWSNLALQENMIGICISNGTALMPPWGAMGRALGNMPMAISAPTDKKLPVVLDMAMSVTSRGRIMLAAKRGETIPTGWALDKDGRPTTDPHAALAGSVLPVAGYKGSGIAIMIEILCGVLLGGKLSHECGGLAPQEDKNMPLGFNNIFCAINIENFIPPDEFAKGCDRMIEYFKSLPTADGCDEVFMPGEIQFRMAEERKLSGISLDLKTFDELRDVAEKYNVDFSIT